jgi:hypothetical protein
MIAEAFLDAPHGAKAATHLPAETPGGELIGTMVFLIILAVIADLSAVRRRPRRQGPARSQRRRRGSSS